MAMKKTQYLNPLHLGTEKNEADRVALVCFKEARKAGMPLLFDVIEYPELNGSETLLDVCHYDYVKDLNPVEQAFIENIVRDAARRCGSYQVLRRPWLRFAILP